MKLINFHIDLYSILFLTKSRNKLKKERKKELESNKLPINCSLFKLKSAEFNHGFLWLEVRGYLRESLESKKTQVEHIYIPWWYY